MTGSRPGLFAGVMVGVLVLAAASGLFAIQYVQVSAQCSFLAGGVPCNVGSSTPMVAGSALFVAIAGLLAAIVMAITAGVNARADGPPNVALARQIEAEDAAYKRAKERYEELKELNMLAMAHAQEAKNGTPVEVDGEVSAEALAQVSESLSAPGESAAADAGWQEEPRPESDDEKRKRIMAERLRNLARQKPDAVAEVLKTWINQR